jgi:hypothetical protein
VIVALIALNYVAAAFINNVSHSDASVLLPTPHLSDVTLGLLFSFYIAHLRDPCLNNTSPTHHYNNLLAAGSLI